MTMAISWKLSYFSAIMMFVCKSTIRDCIKKSKTLHKSGGGGRGSLVTLLSKHTVNKVIDIIRLLMQRTISSKVRNAGMFSIQLDTTQDMTSKDQCEVVLRYVTDHVHER